MTRPGIWPGSGAMLRWLVASTVASTTLAVMCSMTAQALATNSTTSGVAVQTLAQGHVQALGADKVFVSILDFHQVPGAECGPTCGLPGLVYTLHGVATVSFPGAGANSVTPGDAAFSPGVAVLSNTDRRVGTGAIVVGVILVVVILWAATWLRGGRRRLVVSVLSISLVAGSVLSLTGAMSNEWYFFSIRPDWQSSLPMPSPDGRVTFLSADVYPLPAAPYVETLAAITVAPGARYDAPNVPGPETVMVVDGTATVSVGAATRQLANGQAALAQPGMTLTILNAGSDYLRILDFALMPAPPAPA
jgi:mannose-6-phosphate isomerase-like protein (cupin superfamily)